MHAHGVDVLDEADRDHLVLRVADDLELELLPAENGLLDQDLADEAGGEAAGGDDPQLLDVVDQPAAGAAHRVGRADDDRVAEVGGDLLGLLDAVGGRAARHLDAEPVHRLLEGHPVLAALDGVGLDADDLDAVLLEDARACASSDAEVQAGLPAEVGQQGVGPLLGDDLRQRRERQRLDVGRVGHAGVGHDRRRVGVHQHDLVAQLPQRLAGLGAGVVELAGLPDHDRTRTDDHHLSDVAEFRHDPPVSVRSTAPAGFSDRAVVREFDPDLVPGSPGRCQRRRSAEIRKRLIVWHVRRGGDQPRPCVESIAAGGQSWSCSELVGRLVQPGSRRASFSRSQSTRNSSSRPSRLL